MSEEVGVYSEVAVVPEGLCSAARLVWVGGEPLIDLSSFRLTKVEEEEGPGQDGGGETTLGTGEVRIRRIELVGYSGRGCDNKGLG